MELGRTTKFTATEAANAMEVMGRAGFKNSEILGGIGGILNAAAAEGAEMAEVTSHVSNVLKGMGLQASEAGKVADVLALASARTNSSISSLGESMKNLSPVARQFGISLEDSVSMVALLQDVGLDASEAGTATATMLTKLAKPSKEAREQMAKLGVTFKDTHGNMLPAIDVFQQMLTASGKLPGNMDKVAFFAELVGLRGQKAALNLQDLFNDPKKGQALVKELKAASGTAEKMANLSMDNLIGDITLLDSAIDGVKVALYNTESVGLRNVIKGLTEWIGKNQELIVGGFTSFMTGLRDNLPKIVTWLERIGKVVVTLYAFAAAVKAIAVATALWNALMAVNPVVLIIYAIVAAIALLWAFWPEISAFFSKLWKTITDFASSIWDSITGFFSGLGSAISDGVKAVVSAVTPFFTALTEYIVGLATILLFPFRLAWAGIMALFRLYIGLLIAIWTPIGEFFAKVWNKVSEVATAVWDKIVSGAQTAWGFVTDLASSVATRIQEIWTPIGEFFSGLWDGIANAFSSALSWVIDKIEWLASKAGWIVDLVRTVGRDEMDGEAGNDFGHDLISPAERTARSIEEHTSTSKSEITVKAEKGTQARVSKPMRGAGTTLNLRPTGAL